MFPLCLCKNVSTKCCWCFFFLNIFFGWNLCAPFARLGRRNLALLRQGVKIVDPWCCLLRMCKWHLNATQVPDNKATFFFFLFFEKSLSRYHTSELAWIRFELFSYCRIFISFNADKKTTSVQLTTLKCVQIFPGRQKCNPDQRFNVPSRGSWVVDIQICLAVYLVYPHCSTFKHISSIVILCPYSSCSWAECKSVILWFGRTGVVFVCSC